MKKNKPSNIWQDLKRTAQDRPILALAPMAGITDSAFRHIGKEFGADVVYSEMASAAALHFQPKKTFELLRFSEMERPYIIQLFGSEPRHFERAVKLVEKTLAPDGIDINFGCPVKKVAKQGAGAVLMDKPKQAREIIKSVIGSTTLPVSAKLRTRAGKTDVHNFLDSIADLPLAAIMIHGRTFAQGHSGEVDWPAIKKARQHFGGIILANGGVVDVTSAIALFERTEADGIGIARGALGRPWLFSEIKKSQSGKIGRQQIFSLAFRHARLMKNFKGSAGIVEMRKHLCWYVSGQPDASDLRRRLVKVETLAEIEKILE